MSTFDEHSNPQLRAEKDSSATNKTQAIRWWPALLLIMLMFAIRHMPGLVESPTLPMFIAAFMGPAILSGVILLWWLFASRASWKERLIGFFSIVFIAIGTVVVLDKSMRDMNLMFYIIPTGVGLFAAAMILLANQPSRRLPIAVFATLVGFGSWNVLRSEGVTGKFDPTFAWRWTMSAEEKFNAKINQESKDSTSTASASSLALADSIKLTPIGLSTSPWPAFRGSSRDGKYPGMIIEEDWEKSPPKLLWKISVGPGWGSFSASVSAASNLLFTQEQRGDKEAVVCLSAETGERIWIYEYASRFEESVAGAGPRGTPTIANEGLFSLGANGILSCLVANAGTKIWERDLQVDADRKPPTWGFSSSPLVVDGIVIVHAGGSGDKGLLAYDAKTGEPRWSTASGDHSYSSPQIASFDGVSGVLMETNSGLQFINAKDGSTIWQFDSVTPNYRTLQPLVIGNSVLLATALGSGTQRILVTREGDKWNLKEEWPSRDMKPDFNDFVDHEGSLYGFDGNIFGCINLADGKRRWKKGRYGNGQVLLLPDADQMLITSEQGELVLIKADSSKLVELAKLPAITGKTWNHSMMIGDRVFMRNGEEAACYDLPNPPISNPSLAQ
jgi:outer membrane protein assembly factor BamB